MDGGGFIDSDDGGGDDGGGGAAFDPCVGGTCSTPGYFCDTESDLCVPE
jgi:hypothetical protein